ncbi:MAG: hypothetical protein MUC31_05250 [Bacteroidales bacterium]|jgi:acyl carrier protein|nr:hypothetical protein [Bacteroidales bacterium]
MESKIRDQMMALLDEKLQRLAIRESEITGDFDLVKSGFLNSLEFVDMVATLEKMNQVEIDFEAGLNSGDFTTVSGLIRTFSGKL